MSSGLLDYIKDDGKTAVQINQNSVEAAEALGWKPAGKGATKPAGEPSKGDKAR